MLALFAAAFFLCGHYDHGNPKGEPCPVRPARSEFGWCASATGGFTARCSTNSPNRLVCYKRGNRTYCDL